MVSAMRLVIVPAVGLAVAMVRPVPMTVMRLVVAMVRPVPWGHVVPVVEAVMAVQSARVDEKGTNGCADTVVTMRIAVAHADMKAVLGIGGGAGEEK